MIFEELSKMSKNEKLKKYVRKLQVEILLESIGSSWNVE